MKTIDVFLQSLLAILTFFWLLVFVLFFPYPINLLFLGIVTLILLILSEIREIKNDDN